MKDIPQKKDRGFTIVELLIVIVVIGVLAAITIVAYSQVQASARDSSRKSAVATIIKALDMYYTDNGRYPASSGSTVINASWATTADASWSNLETALRPYAAKLPAEPKPTTGVAGMSVGGYNFDYYANSGSYCGAGDGQMYLLVYKLERGSQVNTASGSCTTNPLAFYPGASNHRVAR